jgi:SH3-like domain-containing protein
MRVGPLLDYATSYVYSARGVPLEITEEYGHWRRVRDEDGSSGWMFAALLSSRRTAVVGPWLEKPVSLRADPSSDARTVAKLAARVRLDLSHCDGSWCRAALQDRRLSGFIRQVDLWGVYPGETIE